MTERVDIDLEDYADQLAREGARFPVLACALFARERGRALDESTAALVAKTFGRDSENVLAVFALVEGAATEGRIRACRGVSCRSVGADALGDDHLARTGLEVETVLCLNNCDRGPSLEHDQQLYCGTDDAVIVEERSWRG